MIICKEFIEKNVDKVSFHREKLLKNPLENNKGLYHFKSKELEVQNPKLNLSMIKGASYTNGSAVAKTWSDMLKLLSRYSQYVEIDCERNREGYPSVDYYFGDKYINDDPWGIEFINGVGYILEGHHRTTIAKYLAALEKIPNEISGFKYARYIEIDMSKFKQYNKIKTYINSLPDFISKNISFSVTSKYTKDETKENLEIEYQTIFRVKVGIVYFYDENIEPITTDFNTISTFRNEIFKQLRQLHSKYKYLILFCSFVSKINFLKNFIKTCQPKSKE